jgi:hypothetical protein
LGAVKYGDDIHHIGVGVLLVEQTALLFDHLVGELLQERPCCCAD